MKNSILLLAVWIMVLPSLLFSQKFDNVWVMGYNWDADPEAETYRLNFDTFPPRLEIYPGDIRIGDAYAGFCDSSGNLQVYTNNCAVANGEGNIITNGDTMTAGFDLFDTYQYKVVDQMD